MISARYLVMASCIWLMTGQLACGGGAQEAATTTSSGGSPDGQTGGANSGGIPGSGGSGASAGSGGFGGFGTGGIWLGAGGTPDPGCAPEGLGNLAGSGGAEPGPTLMERWVPYQEYPSSGESVTGVLYVNRGAAYGDTIDHLRSIGTSGDVPLYFFATDGSSPFWQFFTSSGEGEAFDEDREIRLGDMQTTQIASARFGPQTPNPWGLEQEAYIVTLEVNGQLGSPGGFWPFVATDVTILSGTAEVPMNPAQTMADAAGLFAGELEALDTELDALAADALERANPTCGTLTEQDVVGVLPSWQAEDKQLSLTFVHLRQKTWAYRWLISPGTSGTPPQHGQATRGYAVEYATRYDYDATGALLEATTEGPIATDLPQTDF